MLKNWNESHNAAFQKEIMSFEHELESTGLFSDAALIELLEKHPSEALDVCSMGDPNHPLYPNKLRTGDFRGASAKGGILISSPIAKVPYHFDKTETILWHVRGKKRMYLYPLTPEFIPDTGYERAVVDMLEDDLPYRSEWDEEHASIYDLQPGQALTWPMNMPHRVDNQTFCVSVTTEYTTVASGRRNAAMLANATLRHKFGMTPSYWNAGPTENYIKSIFGRVIKKTGFGAKVDHKDYVTFRVEPSAENYIVDIEPFERNF